MSLLLGLWLSSSLITGSEASSLFTFVNWYDVCGYCIYDEDDDTRRYVILWTRHVRYSNSNTFFFFLKNIVIFFN